MHRCRLDVVHRDAGLCICPVGVRADAASPRPRRSLGMAGADGLLQPTSDLVQVNA